MQTRSDELAEMKRIDFCQYVASRGFVLDRKHSSRCSVVMRHPNGDKLIIGRAKSGQFMYFNAKGNDNGTIIDFVQSRDRISLGEVRKMLRPWLGSGASPLLSLPTLPFELQPSEHDAARVLATWMKANPIGQTHAYLETERKIPREVLAHEVFRDRVRRDERRNALYVHFNQVGVCGIEIKNIGFTGFSPGGIKGLACSRSQSNDRQMIICETFIDMLSYAALHGIEGNRFFSTAGQISPAQGECLRSAASKMPQGSMVVLALDHDEGGLVLAAKIEAELATTGLPIMRDLPPCPGDDWNDVLRRERSPQINIAVSP
jgi:hypothetical protein